MRQERTVQASLFDLFAEHEIGRELKAMSQWLDEHSRQSHTNGRLSRSILRHPSDLQRRSGARPTVFLWATV